jgi:hypothetical protein
VYIAKRLELQNMTGHATSITSKDPASQEKPMRRKILRAVTLRSFALVFVLASAWHAQAQDVKIPYPTMAPLDQYLIPDRNAEIALARSAAPESISQDAEVMVLGIHGYETTMKGKNGFVCMVWRSWAAGIDDPEFWNPKLRAPVCFNPPAARFNVPLTRKRTELVLAGRSKSQIFADLGAALDRKELPALEPGAMCYMLSKQGYLSDRDGHWRPHLMFFVPLTEPESWGVGLPGSPVVVAFTDTLERHTVFLIAVAKWSDGTPSTMDEH